MMARQAIRDAGYEISLGKYMSWINRKIISNIFNMLNFKLSRKNIMNFYKTSHNFQKILTMKKIRINIVGSNILELTIRQILIVIYYEVSADVNGA